MALDLAPRWDHDSALAAYVRAAGGEDLVLGTAGGRGGRGLEADGNESAGGQHHVPGVRACRSQERHPRDDQEEGDGGWSAIHVIAVERTEAPDPFLGHDARACDRSVVRAGLELSLLLAVYREGVAFADELA